MERERLRQLTEQLLAYNQAASNHFQEARESGVKADFFEKVKPFADEIKSLCEEWEPQAVEWTITNKPKNLYPIQLHHTAENLQMVSVRAFFAETSLKKFNSHIQSIEFVLERLLENLKKISC